MSSSDQGPHTPAVLHLSADEALVLFEFLARVDYEERLAFADAAEERVLTTLLGQLEKQLVAPFDSGYTALLARARDQVRGGA